MRPFEIVSGRAVAILFLPHQVFQAPCRYGCQPENMRIHCYSWMAKGFIQHNICCFLPPEASRAALSSGTVLVWLSISILESLMTFSAFVLNKPMVLI